MSAYGCIGETRARASASAFNSVYEKEKKQRKTTESNRNQRAHARKQKQKPSVVRGLNFRFISYRVRPIRKNWILVFVIYFFRYKKRKTFRNPVGFTFLFCLSVKNAHFSMFSFCLYVCVAPLRNLCFVFIHCLLFRWLVVGGSCVSLCVVRG